MLENGHHDALGATVHADGVNFALWSGSAEAVELCLFDEQGRQVHCLPLPGHHSGVWFGFLPGGRPGQRYGYRVHGAWEPREGLRHNPAKLLLDPYARRLDGDFHWHPSLLDSRPASLGGWRRDETDSAPCMPFCVVEAEPARRPVMRPTVPWSSAVIWPGAASTVIA